ncbi:major head protein [Mycobacterium phage Imvubu]|uniref:Major capsid hexamer protein n=1 Tax=Mycobacterium phage Imvubu TaxID=2686233 RepID=A0A6B9L827_9CAUD|nr:major head protein [Mycobacterium phage Imvubu]QHB37750.1 major capsid hexamer protein [Mycobacterium phage Imvubu]
MTILTPTAPARRIIRLHGVGQFTAAVGFQMPDADAIAAMSVAELDALLEAARAEAHVFEAQHAAGRTLSADDISALRALVGEGEAIDTLEAARATAVAAEADHSAELGDLLSRAAGRRAPEAPAGTPANGGPEGEQNDDEDGNADGATDTGQAGTGEQPPAASAPGDAAPQTDAVAASAGTTGAQRGVNFGNTGTDAPPAGGGDAPEPGWELNPSVPGYTSGQSRVGFAGIAQRLDAIRPGSRAARNGKPRTMDGQSFTAQVVAALSRDMPVVDDPHALVAAINTATSQVNGQRVTAQALTAAGGWCAPSEQLYDFCDVPDATDLLSLPEIAINRGGVRWPREPDLSGIFEDFEWFFTEPELEATDAEGNPTAVKTCVEVPCPEDFDEIRLNAVGWCVEAGILQEQGWPELIEWFMRSLTQEHLRALSRRSILNIVAGSGAAKVIPPASVLGSVASVLNSLALVATNIRLKRGLSRTATIEGIAPSWFFEVLRADLAFREGTDTFAVTDAQILGWLTARNIALQFVGDWQTRSAGLPGHMDTLKWPTTVDIVMYPAGTWFRSMSNVIELGVMYPKEQLQVNRFTRMFTEDAIAVGKRCGESALVRVPLDVNGAIGERLAASNA